MVTYTPFKALHGAKIEDDGNAEINVERYSGANIRIQSQASAGRIETTNAHELWLGANGSGRIEIQSGGLVSIPGNLTVSGTFNATLATAAQTNITSLGSLSSLDVNGDATVSGNLSLDGSNKELRFYEGSNYVGFEAPALSADQIWVLPAADGSANQALTTDGSGNFQWTSAGSIAGAGSNLSLANGTNNRIVTAVDGSNLNGEANLTFDGSTLTVAGNMLVNNNGSIKANGSGSLLLGNTSSGIIKVHGDASSSIVEGYGNHLILQTVRDNDDIIFRVNAGGTASDSTVVEAMRIHGPDANVGIGVTAPEYKLDVQDGSVRILPTISSNAGTAIRIGARGNGNDITLLRIDGEGAGADGAGNTGESDSAKYGFSMKYMGSGSGEGNRYAMFMDNQAGSAIEAMSILQGGNVGIGTTSPETLLNVDNGTIQIGLQADSLYTQLSNNALMFHRAAASYIDQQVDNGDIRFRMNAANDDLLMLDGSAMRVGIGTTSPDYELDVAGDIGINSYLRHNGDADTYIKFDTDGIRLVAGNDLALHYEEDSTSKLHLSYNGEADVEIGNAGGTPDFFFGGSQGSYNGKMGIGTTAPAVQLHVAGTADQRIRVQDTTDNYAVTMSGKSDGSFLFFGDIDSGEGSFMTLGAFSGINNLYTESRDFHLYGTNTTTGFYFDESAGNFGIGTTSPTHKLHLSDSSRVDIKFSKDSSEDHYIRKDGDYLRLRVRS